MNFNRRNYPPTHGIRVPAEEMKQLVVNLFTKVSMSAENARVMADLLVQTDLHCVFSHGTKQIADYIGMIRDGRVNPQPKIEVVSESKSALVIDGDGGMGHLPCYFGTHQVISKAKDNGCATLTTHNHYHFGAAGKYTRIALAHDCISIAISSHRISFGREDLVSGSAPGSPISIAIPSGDQPPLVLDMGGVLSYNLTLFEQYPSAIFKSMGLGAVMQSLGGILAGIYKPEFQKPKSLWESNQGAFIAIFDVNHFMPVSELKKEMDRYINEARSMKPLPNMDQAELAGGLEWQWALENRQSGIPLSFEHQEILETVATELAVDVPFNRYQHTRF